MYSASQEGHGKSSAYNKCCNTLILFIATLCNIVRRLRGRQDEARSACEKTPLLKMCSYIYF